jgi:hypothetical protein
MKRIAALLLAVTFAGVILLPVNVTVNKHYSENQSIADGGVPIPPPPPCAFSTSSAALEV